MPAASAIPATGTARYAYAVEANAGEKNPFVVAYSVNPQTGYLRPLESIIPLSDNFGVVVDPSNQFLYLPDGPQIIGYRIAVNGMLQPLKGSPFNLYGGSTIVFTPDGKFAYSNLGTEFSFNSTTGAFTQIGAVDQGGIHDDVAIDPTGSFLYILNSSTISGFSIDQTTGALTEITGSPFASGETYELYSDVVSPDGKFLFVTTIVTGDSGFTGVFSIGTTGALTPVAGSPFASPGNSAIVGSDGQYLYVGGENLAAYSIDASTGVLTQIPGSPYTTPSLLYSLTLDPTGKFLYGSLIATASSGAGTAGTVTYSVNSSSGALTQIYGDGSLGERVEAIAISTGSKAVVYTPKFAYSANHGGKSVSEWTIKDSTGALTAVAGSPIADGNGPQLVASTPSGAFVYTGNANNTISEYSVNATTGALTLASGSPLTGFGSVNTLVVDPTGSNLFVLDSTKQLVDSYTINTETGALTFFSSVATAAGAQMLTLDPTGCAAAITSPTGVQIALVNAGTFGPFGQVFNTKNSPGAATFDQSTQYLIVTEPKNNAVAVLSLQGLKQISATITGNTPGAILAEPSGKFVYVANTGDGTITAYSLNNLTGALKKIGSATAAAGTNALSVSNDGKYLYATNGTAGSVSIFKIVGTGALTAAGTATTTGTSPTAIITTGNHQ
ncbi:MAG TPA: beta-propeller fold lactonase family protein [Candidatus Sulfotelmatobacter sp.]